MLDYGNNAEAMANTRLPYSSDGNPSRPPVIPSAAFIQLSDDIDLDDEMEVNTDIPETLEQTGDVPLNFSFL